MCGAADNNLFHIELIVFRLTEGRLELLIISVYLLWVLHCQTHLLASQLEGWSYSELHPNCLYADIETKENPFQYFYMLFVLCFLIRSPFINYFLIVRTSLFVS